MNRVWIRIVLAGIGIAGRAAEPQPWPPPRPAAWAVEPASNAFVKASDFDSPASTTRGIQEAIEALPPGGGTVFVSPGVHRIERTIALRPGTQLIGAGRNTVLQKAPLVIVPLAEDVRKGADQDYVVARDPSALRPGMAVTVCDRQQVIKGAWKVARLGGNKVYLGYDGYDYAGGGSTYAVGFKPTAELRVDRGAALVTAFWMISPAPDSLIENLSVDGNKEGQMIGGKKVFMDYAGVPEALRAIKGVGMRCTLRRLWIYDCAGVNVSCSSGRALITDCDIWGGYQGIHLGAGPLVKIVNNLVHDHEHIGISFCMGNFGCIVAQNHVYQNLVGIGALGCRIFQYEGAYSNRAYLARDGDHYHIITQNQVFNNRRAGISSGQGHLGPTDYVITGNIVMNNNLDGEWALHKDDLPGGMAFHNARNCVIANNRCYDDQDEFGCGELTEDAPAGSVTLTIKAYDARPVNAGPFHDPPHYQTFRLALSNGTDREEVNVVRRDRKERGNVLHLDAPLKFAYPKGTDPRILKSQQWGIIVTGPESRGNVISGNQCSENAVGGLLVYNEGGAVGLNAGGETPVDPERSFLQNLYPAVTVAGPANPGFEEGGGWTLGAGASLDGAVRQAGAQSLKLALAEDRPRSEARSAPFELKPDRRYRVSGWVRVGAEYRSAPRRNVLPMVALVTPEESARAMPALGTNGCDASRAALEPGAWRRFEGVLRTGGAPAQGYVHCRLEGAAGAAWFDAIQVEELKAYPMRPFGPEAGPAGTNAAAPVSLSVPPEGAGPAVVRGLRRLDDPAVMDPVDVRVRRRADALEIAFSRMLGAGERPNQSVFYAVVCPAGLWLRQYRLRPDGAERKDHNGLMYDGEWLPLAGREAAGVEVEGAVLTARLTVPLAELGGEAPKNGAVWRAQFGHTRDGGASRHTSSWNGSKDWAEPAAFGCLVF